jgi:hypothetical protein
VDISDAQRDVRTVFLGGFAGQLVSSGVWLLSAAAATWLSHRTAVLVLVIALGSHYLPFMFLYGMRQFGALSALLVASGVVLGMYLPTVFSAGAWLTAVTLLVFAITGRSVTLHAA